MAKISKIPKERTGILLKATLECLLEAGNSLGRKEIFKRVEKLVEFTPSEKEKKPNGQIRWKDNIAWYSTNLVKAGWITKGKKGVWSITEAGTKALRLDPIQFVDEVSEGYEDWLLAEKHKQVAQTQSEVKILNAKNDLAQRKPPDPKSSPISSLIKDYLEKKLLLPEIQRSYVWKAKKIRDLMDSIYRGYPAGSILIWETSGSYETKEAALSGLKDAAFGGVSLLLDGQQRLTSLATVIAGVPIRLREGNKVKEKQIELYFNLDHEETFSYTPIEDEEKEDDIEESLTAEENEIEDDVSKLCFHMKAPKVLANPHWIPVTKLYTEGIATVLRYAQIDLSHPNYEVYFNRLNTLYNRKDNYYFPIQVLKDYGYDEVTEVFVRVNSSATRLRGSDLALAQVTSRWRGSIKLFEGFIDEFGVGGFAVSEGFLIRCIVAAATGQSRFQNVSKISVDRLKETWERVKEALSWTKHFIQENARLDSLSIIPSNYLLIVVAVYALRRNGKLTSTETSKLLYWFYSAAIWGRYSGSSESKLDQDLAALDGENPIDTMIQNIKQQTGRLQLDVDDVKQRGVKARGIFMMSYAVARHRNAKDWGTGLHVNLQGSSKKFVTEFDHVFPQSKLDAYLRETYDDEQYRKKVINEIANLVFLSKGENYPVKSNRLPAEYLCKIIELHGEAALTAQCVPTNSYLWDLARFEDFLAERRKLLVQAINELLEKTYQGVDAFPKVTITDLIRGQENQNVEFKSSLHWDYKENRSNKALEHVIAKTVSSFMNSTGGILLIGVDDKGGVLGLQKDFDTLHKPDQDGFSLKLTEIVNNFLGTEFNKYVHQRFEEIDGKHISVVEVERSNTPVYVESQGKTEFYIRAANSSQPLDIKQAAEYIKMHF
jgi:hypothetical protein